MELWSYLKENMMKNPDRKICEDTAEMSFEEMIIFAELFAEKISGEKCCAIMCGSEMASAMALLSCFAAGVTALPLSLRYGQKHCGKILEAISPTCLITDEDNELRVIYLEDDKYNPPEPPPALIMCTSGTTGTPKGVMLGESNILANVGDILRYFEIGGEDSILIARPLYHCAVLTGEFLVSLVKGVKIRFYSGSFSPKLIADIIEKNEITVFCATPTLLGTMIRLKCTANSLRRITVSGECLGRSAGAEIKEAFPNAEIYHVYGLTEACPRVSCLPPSLFGSYPDSVGKPLESVRIKILNESGGDAKANETGILWVKGPNVMQGYYNSPELTEKVLTSEGWLCTGDAAYIDGEGLLRIIGRSDDMIIRAGMNIYPQEIENELKKDPRVREAVVYGVPNKLGMGIGLDICGEFGDVSEVRQLCADLLPPYQVPNAIEIRDELPRNGSGKIIRGGRYA